MRKHILLIDDEPYFRFGIELALRKSGYLVSQASDGKEALERLLGTSRHFPVLDLILLDLELPTLSAAEIVRRLRAEAVTTPVLAFSGFFNASVYEELMKLGCLELLFKPVSEQLLLERIERALKPQSGKQ
jgi:DNA-binding response OmpR family regulator